VCGDTGSHHPDVPDNPAGLAREFDLPSLLVADLCDGISPSPGGFLLSDMRNPGTDTQIRALCVTELNGSTHNPARH
jgi:hypothetical protein